MNCCILREDSTALFMYIYLSIDPQVEDLRTELMTMRKEKAELQSSQLEASRHVTQSHANNIHGEMGRGRPHWSGNEYDWVNKEGPWMFYHQYFRKFPEIFQWYVPAFIHENPHSDLWYCAHTHIFEYLYPKWRHWQQWILASDSPQTRGHATCIMQFSEFRFGFSLPHWRYGLNVSIDRGTLEKVDAELRIHRPTSTSDEDEGLRKALEVRIKIGNVCRQRRRSLLIQSHAVSCLNRLNSE